MKKGLSMLGFSKAGDDGFSHKDIYRKFNEEVKKEGSLEKAFSSCSPEEQKIVLLALETLIKEDSRSVYMLGLNTFSPEDIYRKFNEEVKKEGSLEKAFSSYSPEEQKIVLLALKRLMKGDSRPIPMKGLNAFSLKDIYRKFNEKVKKEGGIQNAFSSYSPKEQKIVLLALKRLVREDSKPIYMGGLNASSPDADAFEDSDEMSTSHIARDPISQADVKDLHEKISSIIPVMVLKRVESNYTVFEECKRIILEIPATQFEDMDLIYHLEEGFKGTQIEGVERSHKNLLIKKFYDALEIELPKERDNLDRDLIEKACQRAIQRLSPQDNLGEEAKIVNNLRNTTLPHRFFKTSSKINHLREELSGKLKTFNQNLSEEGISGEELISSYEEAYKTVNEWIYQAALSFGEPHFALSYAKAQEVKAELIEAYRTKMEKVMPAAMNPHQSKALRETAERAASFAYHAARLASRPSLFDRFVNFLIQKFPFIMRRQEGEVARGTLMGANDFCATFLVRHGNWQTPFFSKTYRQALTHAEAAISTEGGDALEGKIVRSFVHLKALMAVKNSNLEQANKIASTAIKELLEIRKEDPRILDMLFQFYSAGYKEAGEKILDRIKAATSGSGGFALGKRSASNQELQYVILLALTGFEKEAKEVITPLKNSRNTSFKVAEHLLKKDNINSTDFNESEKIMIQNLAGIADRIRKNFPDGIGVDSSERCSDGGVSSAQNGVYDLLDRLNNQIGPVESSGQDDFQSRLSRSFVDSDVNNGLKMTHPNGLKVTHQ